MAGLIISTVGDDSCHPYWREGLEDSNLWLVYYGDDDEVYHQYSKECDKIFRMKGQKFCDLLYKVIKQEIKNIKNYSHVWLPDDDMRIRGNDIDFMFEQAQMHGLNLCQPSLWPPDNVSWGSLLTVVGRRTLIRLNTVECQAPCFSTEFLLKIYEDLFPCSYSGWGLDLAWGWLLRQDHYLEWNPTLVNNIYMEHMRPVGGNYTEEWRQRTKLDVQRVVEKYKIPQDHMKIKQL